MAKVVIAGPADCPYFARAELLGDKLALNLPDFKLHKIVQKPDDWKKWLSNTCADRGWKHEKSPLVWRELIDRGGKGVLIGGANEFQEYAKGYYGIESNFNSSDMRKIGSENQQCKVEIDKEVEEFKALSSPIHVCVTNASSNVGYALLNAMSRGEVLGAKTELIIHLFDAEAKKDYLEGVKMEVEDLAYGLLRNVVVETNIRNAFKDSEYIVLLDEVEQGSKSREDWIKENAAVFKNYAKIIDEVASKRVKVLISGAGPVNFNAYMMIKNAPNIPRQNIVAMSRLVENHSKAVIAERLKVNSAGVVDLIVWGNPNGEHYIDVDKSRVHNYDGAIIGPDSFSVSGPEMVFDKKWLETEFLELVKTRKQKSEEAMGHAATISQAGAINTTLNHWANGSPEGQMFSLGVCSNGWYGIPKELVFSFPVIFDPKGYWTVVADIDISDEVKAKINASIKDLESEIEVIFPSPKPPTPEGQTDANTNQSADDDKKEGDEQRLETIIEEKKESSEEDTSGNTTTTKTDTEKTDGETTEKEDEKKDEEKKDEEKKIEETQEEAKEEVKEEVKEEIAPNTEEQLPSE